MPGSGTDGKCRHRHFPGRGRGRRQLQRMQRDGEEGRRLLAGRKQRLLGALPEILRGERERAVDADLAQRESFCFSP